MKKKYILYAAFGVFNWFLIGIASGQSGIRDATFGLNGSVFTNENFYSKVVSLPNKKILLFKDIEIGINDFDILLQRLNNNGTPDSTFGVNSKLQLDFGDDSDSLISIYRPSDMAALPNGKILICGDVFDHRFEGSPAVDGFVLRLEESGKIDSSFGTNGMLRINFGEEKLDRAEELVVLPDGSFIVWVTSYTFAAGNMGFAFIKVSPGGMLDATFGQSGIAKFPNLDINPDWAHVAVGKNGKVVLAGHNNAGSSYYQFTANGALDNTFGQNGHAAIGFNIPWQQEVIYDVQIDQFGRIYTCSGGFWGGSEIFKTVRLLANGNRDSTFSEDGIAWSSLAQFDCRPHSLVVQPDGKVIVAGSGLFDFQDFYENWIIARYDSNGELDPDFGDFGVITASFGAGDYEGANFMTIDSDNKLLVSGYSGTKGTLARYELGTITTRVSKVNQANLNPRLSPNPMQDNQDLVLQFEAVLLGKCKIQIQAIDGHVIQTDYFPIENIGLQSLRIRPLIPTGIYAVSIQTPDGEGVTKLVKQ